MKTTAEQIATHAINSSSAMDMAAELAVDTDQNWDNEMTIYTFADDSVLVVCGMEWIVKLRNGSMAIFPKPI